MQSLGGWVLPLTVAATFAADQLLKSRLLARERGAPVVAFGSIARIRPVLARRSVVASLGFRPVLLSCAWVCCALAVLLIAPEAGRFQAPIARIALGAALGGAAGNLFDVLVRKGVVDYVELGPWPPFNLADVAIVLGVVVGLAAR